MKIEDKLTRIGPEGRERTVWSRSTCQDGTASENKERV